MRLQLDELEASLPGLRAAGVTALDVDLGSVFDTIPVPATEPQPTLFPPEEPKSDRVARELGYRFVDDEGPLE